MIYFAGYPGMLTKLAFLTLGALLNTSEIAAADSAEQLKHDTYMISRDDHNSFRGSHRIYSRKSEGLVEVEYCGRSYWVRHATVAWTELEVEQDYVVRVELNWGKGWRPVCSHPEEQVTLEDLGVFEDPKVIVANGGPTQSRASRFAVIRKAFNAFSGEDPAKSFHLK